MTEDYNKSYAKVFWDACGIDDYDCLRRYVLEDNYGNRSHYDEYGGLQKEMHRQLFEMAMREHWKPKQYKRQSKKVKNAIKKWKKKPVAKKVAKTDKPKPKRKTKTAPVSRAEPVTTPEIPEIVEQKCEGEQLSKKARLMLEMILGEK